MNKRFTSKPLLVGMAASILGTGVGTYAWREEHRPPLLELYVFDLKGSQSIFIRTPDDVRVLLNGGANSDVVNRITKNIPFYSRRIDSVIATDLSDKNISGLIDIVERYRVSDVYIPGVTLDSLGIGTSTGKAAVSFFKALKAKSVTLHSIIASDPNSSLIDMGGVVDSEALFPVVGESFQYSKASSPELILKITHGSNEFVLAGDATKKVQKFIAGTIASTSESRDSGGRVLVTSTSGGAADISKELLDAFQPKYFLYSKAVSYKAPIKSAKGSAADALGSISQEGRINIREQGVVKIVSDGTSIRVR